MRRIMAALAFCLLPFAAAHAAGETPGQAASPPADQQVTRSYAVSETGTPALPADFPYFPYVNPDAPKGGTVTLASLGSFDSFNPFIVRGTAADGVNRVFDTLLQPSADEPATAYGLLAQTVEIPADRMWVAFDLRPEARFNDGTPVTAEDVAWTFHMLTTKGRPFYAAYYADVKDVTVDGPRRVVFHFKSNRNRELPLILGEMAVLPEHWWKGRAFDQPLSTPPLGSGPYRVGHFEFGRDVTYERVPNYWAANLPEAKGMYNFDEIHYAYFRDASVAMEAFKAGDIDFRQENISKNWATGYDFPAMKRGLVIKRAIRHHLPTGMQGFAMNTRRSPFDNRYVREAMTYAFDFEWMNKNLFYNSYTRTLSYFSNSDLASSGLPQGDELKILDQYREKLPPELFTTPYTLPVTDGSGNNRKELVQALKLLEKGGWTVKDRKLVNAAGKQMSFTILLNDPSYERVALPYTRWLSRLGIDVHVRTVDPAQYQHLLDDFDYDMTMIVFPESEVPGNEQSDYWSCTAAKTPGSSNIIGICDPVVDALVKRVISAPDYKQLLPAVHALDRVLLWGWYVVPNWHLPYFWVAYWNRFGTPDKPVRAGFVFDTWWIDHAKAVATDTARRGGK